jgi:hypothetical protein
MPDDDFADVARQLERKLFELNQVTDPRARAARASRLLALSSTSRIVPSFRTVHNPAQISGVPQLMKTAIGKLKMH